MIKLIKMRGLNKFRRSVARVERKVETTSFDFAMAMAELLKREIRENWSSRSPSNRGSAPASSKGAGTTANLDSSIRVERQSKGEGGLFAGKKGKYVYVTADTTKGDDPQGRGHYSGILEDKLNRPFFQPAIERSSRMIIPMAKRYIKVR